MDLNKGGRVRLSHASEEAEAISARSLALLRDIEETIQILRLDTQMLSQFAHAAEELEAALAKNPPNTRIDCDVIVDNFREGARIAGSIYEGATRKLRAAESDPNLTEEDGVAESYREWLAALENYHEAAQRVAERIEEIDADFEEPLPGKFKRAADLAAAIKA
jgi:hypothetical protein